MNTSVANNNVARIITPHDKEVAKRLKAIYMRKRDALGLTQVKLAELTGYEQSTISCHMNGHIALRGVKGIVAYANALEVDPQEIDPRFKTRFIQKEESQLPPLPVATTAGKAVKRKSRILGTESLSLRGILLGAEYEPLFPKDTLVITDADQPIKPGKTIGLAIKDRTILAQVHKVTQRSLTYSMPFGYEACREQNIRTRRFSHEELDTFFPPTPVKVLIKDVSFMAPVVCIELP